MHNIHSSLTGFRHQTISERRSALSAAIDVDLVQLEAALDAGGLSVADADKVVENVIGTYGIPYGLALNFTINGSDYAVPMVVEEPSVIAAASNAAKMVRASGGFWAKCDDSVMAAQVQVYDVVDVPAAVARIREARQTLLDKAAHVLSHLVQLGGGPRDLEVRVVSSSMLVVHIYIDCLDAMGANMVNTAAEALGDDITALARGKRGLRILSNLCDRRLVRVGCRVAAGAVVDRSSAKQPAPTDEQAESVVDAIVNGSRFAELDPYRAVTHNKGIMNGIDPVVIATGNDWRAVEAGAHAYASRRGGYAPLAVWSKEKDEQGTWLRGEMELPLALGIVGGTLRVHPIARLSLKVLGVTSAKQLAMVAACTGLASNLAAVRALATVGIQRGHMALHARSVALEAGAQAGEVDVVAQRLTRDGNTTVEHALRVLQELRG